MNQTFKTKQTIQRVTLFTSASGNVQKNSLDGYCTFLSIDANRLFRSNPNEVISGAPGNNKHRDLQIVLI